ncbi:MAG: ATP-binding cassette domain-containing protein [Planctomycetes bacterium]|nr:ATP-binding cassette domain-containing protein [Planctomycetota bacterium]
MSALLEIRGLRKHFESRGGLVRAVEELDLELERGARLGLVGESGCGKSTTARCIVGLERPSAGSIRLAGTELGTLTQKQWFPFRRRIQFVFQDPLAALDPRQRVGDAVLEPLVIHGIGKPRERRARVHELFEAVGLSQAQSERRAHELSGGQRQRVGIARALALEPEILVLDEPLSALDVSVQAQIVHLFGELAQRYSLAYLLISHDLARVRELCDEVCVMYLGRIVERGPAARLFASPAHPYTRALIAAVPSADPRLERERERILLAGEPPSPLDPPTGCAFHPRCPLRAEVPHQRCERERPQLRPDPEQAAHESACHLPLASHVSGSAAGRMLTDTKEALP